MITLRTHASTCIPALLPQPLDLPVLPVLPRHARYLHHKNECFDWGTFGWVRQAGAGGWGSK